jgi:NTE family protein
VLPTPQDLEACAKPTTKPRWNPLRCFNLLAQGNVLDIFQRALRAAQVQLIAKESALADVVLHPFLCESTWRDFHHFDRFIKAGRDAATQALPQILALTKGAISTGGDHHETTAPHPDLGLCAA